MFDVSFVNRQPGRHGRPWLPAALVKQLVEPTTTSADTGDWYTRHITIHRYLLYSYSKILSELKIKVKSHRTENKLVIMRPSYRPHYASCPSVCPSVCPLRARHTKTKKRRKIKIGVDVPQGTTKWSENC